MSRIATWRKGPNDPNTARRWLVRNEFQINKIDPRYLVLGIAFGIGVALWVAFVLILPKSYGFLGPILPGLVALVGNSRRARRKPKSKEAFGPGDAFKVSLNVQDRHGRATGSDRGWLIFSEGWLLFEGSRTSFALTRGEASGLLYGSWRIKLEDGRFVSFSIPESASWAEELKTAFCVWNAESIPDGEAVLPPTETHPEVWAQRWIMCMYGAAASATVSAFSVALEHEAIAALSIAIIPACFWAASLYARRLREELPRFLADSSSRRQALTSAQEHPMATESK